MEWIILFSLLFPWVTYLITPITSTGYKLICYCFIYLQLFCLISVNNAAELLHSGSGRVGGGNFTYYSMMYEGFVMLELISTEGDCDLFVSQYLAKPSFEPETYCLQSATCGLDSVVIPKRYGYP